MWQTSDVIALFALIISIISVVFSIVALRIQKKLNTTNLQAIYYEEIFKEYLVKKIPDAVRKLKYEQGHLDGSYREISMTLLKMIDDSAYFAYANNSFYNKLRDLYGVLDEEMIKEASRIGVSRDEQKKFIYSVNVDIQEIVKFINKNYSYCV